MRKSDIERLARRRQQQAKPTATHGNAPKIAQDRADDSGGKSHGHECACACGAEFERLANALIDIGPILTRLASIDTVHTAERLVNALIDIGPILARLAAVDTVHTTEQPATLFKRAISEGMLARDMFRATIGANAGGKA